LTFSLNFQKEAISDIELNYVKVQIRPEQLKLIKEISNLMNEHINIPILALRGMIWKALKDWQNNNKKTIADISNMSSAQKVFVVKQIFNFCKDCMKSLLSTPKEEAELYVDIIYEKIFKYYLEYLTKLENRTL